MSRRPSSQEIRRLYLNNGERLDDLDVEEYALLQKRLVLTIRSAVLAATWVHPGASELTAVCPEAGDLPEWEVVLADGTVEAIERGHGYDDLVEDLEDAAADLPMGDPRLMATHAMGHDKNTEGHDPYSGQIEVSDKTPPHVTSITFDMAAVMTDVLQQFHPKPHLTLVPDSSDEERTSQ